MRACKILTLIMICAFVSMPGVSSGWIPDSWALADAWPDPDAVAFEEEVVDLKSLAAKMRDIDRRLLDAQLTLPAFELYHISPELAKRKKMTKGDVIEMIVEVSNLKGINPAIVMAIARAESHYAVDAVSQRGAIGLMQLMPRTAAELGVDPHNPVENVMGGIDYFLKMRCRFKGYTTLGLAAYNAGPGNVIKAGWRIPNIKETRDYVIKVYKYYNEYNGRGGDV